MIYPLRIRVLSLGVRDFALINQRMASNGIAIDGKTW